MTKQHTKPKENRCYMAGRTYRTGVARDRRAFDPAAPEAVQSVTLSTAMSVDLATAASVEITTTFYAVGTSTVQPSDELVATGLASTSRLVDSNGDVYAPTDVIIGVGGQVQWFWDGLGLTLGPAVVTFASRDPAIRGSLGQWAGGGATTLTIA